MQVETVAAEAAAPPPVVESTPAPVEAPVNTPDTPEAREAAINDELSAVWDKQLTNGVEKGQDGRFVAKNGEAKPEPNSADQPQAAQVEPAKPAIEAPQSWSAEARAHWAKLPPEAQQYIAQREGEAHKEITSRGEKLKAFEPLDGVLQSYKDDLSRRGVQPAQAVAMLLEAQRKLDADPLGGLVNIGLTYGIDLRPLLQGQAPVVSQSHPEVEAIKRELSELKQQQTARAQQEEQATVSKAEALVSEFKKDKPYFQDVEAEMLALIPAFRQRHPEASHKDLLDKAYDAAIHANATIRERILTDQRKAEEAKRAEEAAKRAEEARKSGKVNVRSGTAQPTPKSMEETVDELARKFYG
jgi:hypothetical protein